MLYLILKSKNQYYMTMYGSKGLRLSANRELTQIVACRALKSEVLGLIPTGRNILLQDFLLFSCDSVESAECISI